MTDTQTAEAMLIDGEPVAHIRQYRESQVDQRRRVMARRMMGGRG